MWSRSICYRTWVSGAFPVAFMLKEKTQLDAGWARRFVPAPCCNLSPGRNFIAMIFPVLDFMDRRNTWCKTTVVPVVLFDVSFICLALPDDSPFWTARENEGAWEKLGNNTSKIILENPGLLLVNHGKTGTSEIIPEKSITTIQTTPNLFTTHIFLGRIKIRRVEHPWNIVSRSRDPRDLRGDDVNFYLTGQAVTNDPDKNRSYTTSQSMLYNGIRKDVLYRQAIMRKPPNNGGRIHH